MNILDLQHEFKTTWEFIGDNECDRNLLTIKREAFDANGNDIECEESYCFSRNAINEMRLGLEAMLQSIKDYENQ